VHPRRGHGDGIGESDYSFGADQRDGLHLLGDGDECLWDQFGLVGIELGDASGARVELHLYGALGGRIERSVIQLHGDAQRILQRNRYTHAVGRRVIDSGGADVQRLIGGTDIHHHAHGRGSGHTHAGQQWLAYESGRARLCHASLGTSYRNRNRGKWIGIGELHGAGIDGRIGDYLVPGDLQSGRVDRDGIGEPDHGSRADERDRVHLLADRDKYIWDQPCIVGIELGDASGSRVELHLHGTLGRRTECGIVQLHRYAQRALQWDHHDHTLGRRVIDSDCADVQQLIGGADVQHHAHGRGTCEFDAGQQRHAYERKRIDVRNTPGGTGHWRRNGGEWIGFGEFHGAGVNGRIGHYHVPGDLQSGRGDRHGIDESDYGFRADERDGVHLLGDCDE
jgi:hypothetical protein